MEEKKKATWTLAEDGYLAVKFPDSTEAGWKLMKVFPDFPKLQKTQQNVIAYGVKQKLSDSTAKSKDMKLDTKGMIEVMNTTFDAIVDGSAWTRKAGGGGFKKVFNKADVEETAKKVKMTYAQAKTFLEASGFKVVE